MNDKDEKSEDAALWAEHMRDVTPLKKPRAALSDSAQKPAQKPAPAPHKNPNTPRPSPTQTPPSPTQRTQTPASDLDKRTESRLRKGQMPIEGVLDLHGLNQDKARTALTRFILSAQSRGQRCVLVITGKGQKNRDPLAPHDGILKQNLPRWLAEDPLAPFVLQIQPAKPKDGGSGAFYVLLRRTRP